MAEWILAFLLMFGAHEAGHVEQARALGYDLQWRGSIENPLWYMDTKDYKALSLVAGAGFRYEYAVGQSLERPSFKRKARLIGAGRKIAYLFNPTGNAQDSGGAYYGDLSILEGLGDRDSTRAIILITALSDGLELTVGGCRPYFEQSDAGVPMLALGCGF
jgi:hypothetical protein